jgi:CBS domain containing-hemolysin-like protein
MPVALGRLGAHPRPGQSKEPKAPLTDPDQSLGLATYGWRLAVTLLFVLLNGFFVAAEFALVKARPSRLQALAEAGSSRAAVATHIHAHLDRYLSACQLGITLASLILGWLAEPAVAQLLLLGASQLDLGLAPDDPILHGVALALALTVVTILHMTIGEQAPKIWAIHRAETTALQAALPLRVFETLFRPFIWVVNELSNWVLRLGGLSREISEGSHNVDELRSILASSAQAGHITGRQREFAENILGIMDLEVRHILVPRVDVIFLSLQSTQDENLRIILDSGHSRFPLCQVGLDTTIGIIHAKRVMSELARGRRTPDLKFLAQQTVFVSDTQPLSRLILTLQRARSHCAVVLDEHGTAIGLAFLEDALEEIVGPIEDEFDEEVPAVLEIKPGVFELSGGLSLPEAADVLDLDAEELGEGSDTIGGHVVAEIGRLPRKGDSVAIGPYRAIVAEVVRRRIGRLRFEKTSPDDPD